jgi:hypothetical protein
MKTLKPYYFSSFYNQSLYHYLQVRKNTVQLNDSPLMGEPMEREYMETSLDYSVT